MAFEIEVNNRMIRAEKGETILSALRQAGIRVPTICSMKELSPTGACRMCVVEIEGITNLVPSCSYPAEAWMKIKTHSPRVIRARKMLVELLLSNHPDDCLYCERNGNCELQHLAEELNVRERKIPGAKTRYKLDKSSASMIREPSKCILCGRCVRVCEEIQNVASIDFLHRGSSTIIGTAFNKDLNFSSCIQCGQCLMACPTGALTEKVQFADLEQYLNDPAKTVVVQYSPTISVSLAGEFGIKPGRDINGAIHAALRKIGFDRIFETSFGADVQIMEQANELISRINGQQPMPMFSSCCPSWIKFAEQFKPELLPNISTTKSPQQIMGSLIKTWLSEKENIPASDIYSVAIMPCTSKKYEAQRPEMMRKGLCDIDTVITTRELAKLIRLYGIDINTLEPELADEPMQMCSSAGKIPGATGGLMESVIRTFHFLLSGKELKDLSLIKIRGMKDYREIKISINGREYGFAVINGLKGIHHALNELIENRRDIHFVEIMACPGGCIGGGGQPIRADENALKSRMKALFDLDEREFLRVAHKNQHVQELYQTFLGDTLGKKCKEVLHTRYFKKEVLL